MSTIFDFIDMFKEHVDGVDTSQLRGHAQTGHDCAQIGHGMKSRCQRRRDQRHVENACSFQVALTVTQP
jgi:hypothetical protein